MSGDGDLRVRTWNMYSSLVGRNIGACNVT